MNYAFAPAPVITLDAMSSNPFPVRRIFCIGRNFPGSDESRARTPEPIFFMKPAHTILQNNSLLPFPSGAKALFPEVEMVVALHKGGRNIPLERVDYDYVFGYAVGLDMTLRDRLDLAVAEGLPWESAKVFDDASPCSAITPEFYTGNIASGRIELKVNGEIRQEGNVADMFFKVPETVHYLSTRMELFPGDLIYMGTPGLAGAVGPGDVLEASVAGLEPLIITIGQ